MPRTVNRVSDIHLAALDIRRAGELLLHPCGCDGKPHTLAEHLWRSTRDMEPGLQAATYEVRVAGSGSEPEPSEGDETADEPWDPTVTLAAKYRQLVTQAHNACQALNDFTAAHRPDRLQITHTPLTTPNDWCRSHFRFGHYEARWRSDLCRWCGDFHALYSIDPPKVLLEMRRQGQRITQRDVDQALATERANLKSARRKGRKKAS